MERLLILVALATATGLTVMLVTGGVGFASGGGEKRIHVVEKAATETPIDLPPTGDSVGETLRSRTTSSTRALETWSARTRARASVPRVGEASESTWTTFLRGGQITAEGAFFDGATQRSRSRVAPANTGTRAAPWIFMPGARRSSTSSST
jgi:hypothetical protein